MCHIANIQMHSTFNMYKEKDFGKYKILLQIQISPSNFQTNMGHFAKGRPTNNCLEDGLNITNDTYNVIYKDKKCWEVQKYLTCLFQDVNYSAL